MSDAPHLRTAVPFSGVVVCLDEGHLLPRCLASLVFCDEILVVDLGSADGSPEIANGLGARVLSHEQTPIRNRPLHYGLSQARNDWVVVLDPDEVFPAGEIGKVERLLQERPQLSGIRLPWQFYFKGRRLETTAFARPKASKRFVIHRGRTTTSVHVHKEFLDDDRTYRFQRGQIEPVKHYWADSLGEIVRKHRRYLRLEGERLYATGERFSWSAAMAHTLRTLKANLVDHRGLMGGWDGLSLSGLRAWYVFSRWLSLRRYEKARTPAAESARG